MAYMTHYQAYIEKDGETTTNMVLVVEDWTKGQLRLELEWAKGAPCPVSGTWLRRSG